MWLKKNESLKRSGANNLNFLYNSDKFYIMDNHLAAAWCWMKKLTNKDEAGLFHIDMHYDLIDNLPKSLISKNFKSFQSTINDYTSVINQQHETPAARFDNYIAHFRELNPGLISEFCFATHGIDRYDDRIESYRPSVVNLIGSIAHTIHQSELSKWILNLDLDYFYHSHEDIHFRFLTDEYIKVICEEIKSALDKIAVVTIAVSPEFCNGWESAFKTLKVITDYFCLDFTPDWTG